MSAPTCPKCGDTGATPGSDSLDCTACDAAEKRAELDRHMSTLPAMWKGQRDWAAYQFALSRPVTQQPVAWGILSDTCPELTNDPGLGDYWARKGRRVTPLYAAPLPESTSAAQDARDAARYRYLRMCDWFDSGLAVLRNPKKAVDQHLVLGADFPSRDRLDAFIDAAIATGEKHE